MPFPCASEACHGHSLTVDCQVIAVLCFHNAALVDTPPALRALQTLQEYFSNLRSNFHQSLATSPPHAPSPGTIFQQLYLLPGALTLQTGHLSQHRADSKAYHLYHLQRCYKPQPL